MYLQQVLYKKGRGVMRSFKFYVVSDKFLECSRNDIAIISILRKK
jgi:hypothetical protein